jgi:Domain of unknown function (DUF4190)
MVRRNNTRSLAVILIHSDGPTASGRSSSVATEQKTNTLSLDPELTGSAIENELPTYRAISRQAIFSVVFGAVAIFTFAHPLFYVTAILAIVLGILAHRRIRQYSDVLTGHGLANAGITLGLIFGLGVGTFTTVQSYVRTHMATQFARKYEGILQSGSLADMLWYSLHPDGRKDQTGEQLLKTLDTTKPKEKMSMEQKYGQLIALHKRLTSSKEEHVEFLRIESVGEDDSRGIEMPVYAFALYEVHGPGSKEFPEKEQIALAILKGRPKDKQYEWWVDDVRFPYVPKSYVPAAKVPDDGHGHAH